MTPLMIAAEAGREHNVDVLLRAASTSKVLHLVNVVERPDRSNRSAVHYAALNGHSVSQFSLRSGRRFQSQNSYFLYNEP